MRTLRVLKTSTLSVVSAITLCIRSGCLPLTDRAPESSLRLSLNSCSTVAFIWSPRQLLQSDTGVPHFALDPLTYRCLLSPSPAADFAEPRPPRHMHPQMFPTDQSKIAFLITSLTGPALQLAETILNQAGPATQTGPFPGSIR